MFPSTSAFPLLLSKAISRNFVNETKLKQSLFCAACFLLFPTQIEFSLTNWQLLTLQQQKEEAGPHSTCFLLAKQALVQGKVRPWDQLPALLRDSPTNLVLTLS